MFKGMHSGLRAAAQKLGYFFKYSVYNTVATYCGGTSESTKTFVPGLRTCDLSASISHHEWRPPHHLKYAYCNMLVYSIVTSYSWERNQFPLLHSLEV